MGGSGKTALLRHLARWGQTTGLVGEVSYFGYDEKAWTLEQILQTIASKLYGPKAEALGRPSFELLSFQAMPLAAQIQKAVSGLQRQAQRHLLILDNLESVTGEGLAIKNTLSEAERQELGGFLKEMAGSRSLVLLGTRGGEDWLMDSQDGQLHSSDIYDLEGLDPEAASGLAQRVLERNISDQDLREEYLRSDELSRLMKILSGYPLAIQVVLSNLQSQTPAQVMEALRLGKEGLDQKDTQDKTKSILKCIDYSHSNLSAEDQRLLLCLAPFTSVLPAYALDEYTRLLKEQPILFALPFDRWQDVLSQAERWGLINSHEIQGFLRLQPTFPYFLSTRLNKEDAQFKACAETAFYKLYNLIAQSIGNFNGSNDPKKKMLGQILIELEFENLSMALDMALRAKAPVLSIYMALSNYYDLHQNNSLGLKMGQKVIEKMNGYPDLAQNSSLRLEFIAIMDNVSMRQLRLKDYAGSKKSYQDVLNFLQDDSAIKDEKQEKMMCASVYHQLGRVAAEQRNWVEAEDYYQKALKIAVEFNDRYSQASTYHQLGMVAEEQRKWDEAENYYLKALEIKIEFNDRCHQAASYHQLGIVAQEQQKWDEAEDYYQKALEIKIEFNDRYSQASTYHQLGMVAEEQRKWDEAENCHQKALETYIEFNDRYHQAASYHQLGIVAQEQRKWDEAENYYQKALEICFELKANYDKARVYHQLGRVAEEQRKWDEAENYYQKALEIKIEFNDRYSQASTYHHLGRVAQKQRKWDEAENYHQKALVIFKEFDDEYSAGIVQNCLARLEKEPGKEGAGAQYPHRPHQHR
jgi:tetratricopeptide (TPR) repeat protein